MQDIGGMDRFQSTKRLDSLYQPDNVEESASFVNFITW